MQHFCELWKMNRRTLQHIVFWLVYLIWDTYTEFAWATASFRDLSVWGRLAIALSSVLVIFLPKILLCYFILYVPLTRSLKRRQSIPKTIFQFIVAISGAILAQRVIIKWIAFPLIYKESPSEAPLLEPARIASTFLDTIFILGIAVAIKLYNMQLEGKAREQQLVQEKLESELQFLRAQTNPHFLFNTLNNIYALARRESPQAAAVLLRLSKLLRFMLYECSNPTISLADEVKVIHDYLELEKLRYNDRLQINFTEQIDHPNQPIAPLLLLPFIENAFKHGASENRFLTHIDIQLAVRNGQLTFYIKNDKEPENSPSKDGLGLANVQRQLELLYPNAYQLNIENQSNTFKVHLQINLTAVLSPVVST